MQFQCKNIEKVLLYLKRFCKFASKFKKAQTMALQTLSAKRYQTKLKATIQNSGRLGFTDKTAKELQLQKGSRVRFLIDEDKKDFFLAISNEGDEDAFDVRESGTYLYVSTKLLFDEYEFDYKKKNIMFDLVRRPMLDDEAGGIVYKMNIRELPRREKGVEDGIEEE